jgi:hypothetical protein
LPAQRASRVKACLFGTIEPGRPFPASILGSRAGTTLDQRAQKLQNIFVLVNGWLCIGSRETRVDQRKNLFAKRLFFRHTLLMVRAVCGPDHGFRIAPSGER